MKAPKRKLSGKTGRRIQEAEAPGRENRWCEKHGYFIDVEACGARARSNDSCAKCLCRWRQLTFPFMKIP